MKVSYAAITVRHLKAIIDRILEAVSAFKDNAVQSFWPIGLVLVRKLERAVGEGNFHFSLSMGEQMCQ